MLKGSYAGCTLLCFALRRLVALSPVLKRLAGSIPGNT